MAQEKKRVLLIGEKPDTELFAMLGEEGYEVTVCESPQKAWGFVYPIRPHLIILHLEQPSTRDTYALRECRALADGVPVIIATGSSQIAPFMKELGKGAPRFLSLPLKPNAVREVLHRGESESRHQF